MPRFYSRYRTPGRTTKSRRSLKGSTVKTALMRIIRNPFALVQDARIPDGRAHLSLPVKLQAVAEDQIDSTDGKYYLLFFPGLNNALYVHQGSGHKGLPVGAHVYTDGQGAQQDTTGQVIQWRTVSAGLRISLINNATANEGWWEACRIALPKNDNSKYEYGLGVAGDLADRTAGQDFVIPKPTSETNALPLLIKDVASLANHPSYCTGKLRDIDHVMFKLKATGDVHEFNNLNDGTSNNDVGNFVDQGFDAVFIKIHGVQGQTKLLINYVLNQEIVYDEGAELARAMTRYMPYPTIAQQLKAYRNRESAAAAADAVSRRVPLPTPQSGRISALPGYALQTLNRPIMATPLQLQAAKARLRHVQRPVRPPPPVLATAVVTAVRPPYADSSPGLVRRGRGRGLVAPRVLFPDPTAKRTMVRSTPPRDHRRYWQSGTYKKQKFL